MSQTKNHQESDGRKFHVIVVVVSIMFECLIWMFSTISMILNQNSSYFNCSTIIGSCRFSSSISPSSLFHRKIHSCLVIVLFLIFFDLSSIIINAQQTSSSSSSLSSPTFTPSSLTPKLTSLSTTTISSTFSTTSNNDINSGHRIGIGTELAEDAKFEDSYSSPQGQIKTSTPSNSIGDFVANSSSSSTMVVDVFQPSSDNENNNNDLNSSTEKLADEEEIEYQDPMIELHINSSQNYVSNCTDVKFYCEIQSLNSDQQSLIIKNATITPTTIMPNIWWTFDGQNVSSSTLPGGRVIYNSDIPKLSILHIECAQFGRHDGDYRCHHSTIVPRKSSSPTNGSQTKSIIIDSPSLHFEVHVLILESLANKTIRQEIDTELQLKCHAFGHPKPKIEWQRYDQNTLIISNIEPDGRISFDNQSLPDIHETTDDHFGGPLKKPLKSLQSILRFETLKRSDNGTYVCKAQNSEKPKTQEFHVIILEVPEIHIEKIEIENKTSAVVSFVVDYDGNLPIEKYILEIRNYTEENSTWIQIDIPSTSILIKHIYSTIKVDDLVHAANYGFRLSAINQLVGQSEWSMMNITVPADVPSPINNIHLLSKSNETLLFGWRRPLSDNGAAIIHFEQILKDQNDLIIWNQTINNTQSRNKHMSLFSNLQPGSRYLFQIRACSSIGCGEWSPPFEAMTSDGISDPPLNIRLECIFDSNLVQTNATIRWDPPSNPRGSIIGYNISLKGHSIYSNNRHFDTFEQSFQVNGNETFEFKVILRPNSNYTARLCAINKSGCGQYSHLSTSSMCQTSPTGPSEFPPGIHLERISEPTLTNIGHQQVSPFLQERRKLKLVVPKISERNGPFRCVRIIVIRLPHPPSTSPPTSSTSAMTNANSSSPSQSDKQTSTTTTTTTDQPKEEQPSDLFTQFLESSNITLNLKRIPLMTYRMVHDKNRNQDERFIGAYIAKEYKSENFPEEIILGDGKVERCYDDALEYDLKSRIKHSWIGSTASKTRGVGADASVAEDNRSPRRINYDPRHNDSADQLIDAITNHDDVDDDGQWSLVENRELWPNTYYSAAVEVSVMAFNHTLLVEQSPWAAPVQTEPVHQIIPQQSQSLQTTSSILIGSLATIALLSALVGFAFCRFFKRKGHDATPVLLSDEHFELTTFIRRTIIFGSNGGRRHKRKDSAALFYQLNFNSTSAIRKWASKPIPIQNLIAVFQQRRTNSDFLFQAEFEALPESFPDRTTMTSDAEENVGKNRYPDIKSYDQTRVKLSMIDESCNGGVHGNVSDGDDGSPKSCSDYINADYVNGFKDEKRFICAQGPMPKTVPDFWRMIYEQKCCIMVMLTGIEEQGRIKCAQYWSDEKPLKFEGSGQFEVETQYRREYSDYIIRKFVLKNLKTDEHRDVFHFHFVAWKDFLAPDQPSWLLRFIKRVNEFYCPDRGPILVHCSAGVGRTGTFIAIDTLISQIDDGAQEINVFECVSKLRYQRNYLVQSLRQYIFVYRAIMEYVEFGDTEIEAIHLRDHYKQLKEETTDPRQGVFAEFEKLNEVFEESKSCIVGSLDANKTKNRYPFIIPYDFNRVILNPSQDTCYINASFIQGYDHTLSFIVAQDPLEHTVNEFWWMIVEHAVNTLVMLSELGDGQNKCHCYWPSAVDETYDCDFVKVKLIEEEMFQYYIKRVFDVTKKKTNKTHTVKQYQFLSWKSGVVVPESTISLITLTDVILFGQNQASLPLLPSLTTTNPVTSTMAQNGKHVSFADTPAPHPYKHQQLLSSPILVHCSGGGDRSSVFVAFASLVKQLYLEERIDVFQTARYTKSQRHCMLQTIAQYDFLYRCLIDYMDCHSICDNGDTQL